MLEAGPETRAVMGTRAANDPSVFTITEKAPTRAFSWLKAPTSAFTFNTLLRYYALVAAFSMIVKLQSLRRFV